MDLKKNNLTSASSNRSFGIVFFVFFLIVAFWPLKNGEDLRVWSLIISFIFLLLGLINSKILTPLNKLWFKLGIFLGNFISPIVMALVFFLVVTPTGIIMRLFGKNLLRINKMQNVKTYWIKIDKKNSSMRNQF
tara:strand:+ start:183 stop:584 length:402 start_codon:yes stop_codon:yes gene_type:complete